MKKIAYIHFSDLHIGQKYANQYLSNAKDIVLQDLDFILKELKALDVVFFTGDMVQSGIESEYEEFIEDSVFCNDRTIDDMGGWSNTGILTNFLRFNGVQEKYFLKCPHKRDAFTVNDNVKGNASLTYPIGLLTSAESSLQGNYTVQKADNEYWTLTPAAYGNDVVEMKSIKEAGNWEQSSFSYYALGVRPSISLKASVNFKSGTNGSKENPYEIIVNENS